MAAISGLGFAIQAADVGARTAIGLRRGYQHARESRNDRATDYLDTLKRCDSAIENLRSGGAALVVDPNHPLSTCLEKMIATTALIRSLCGAEDIESQGVSDDVVAQRLADDSVWLSFRSLKADMSILEEGLQFFTTSRLINFISSIQSDHRGTMQTIVPLQRVEYPLRPAIPAPPTESTASTGQETPCTVTGQCSGTRDLETPQSPKSSYEEILGLSKIMRPRRRPSDHAGDRCRKGTCPCRCHLQSAVTWRNLTFRFTNPSSLISPCSHSECKGRNINVSTQLRISNPTVRIAVITSLEVAWGLGSVHISPVLRAKRLVGDNSVGFRIVRAFSEKRLGLHEAALALNQAFDSGRASRMDSTLEGSLLGAMLSSMIQCDPSLVERLQLLDMVGLHHGLLEGPEFPDRFRTGFSIWGVDLLEALEPFDLLYDIGSTILGSHSDYTYLQPSMEFRLTYHMKPCIARYPGFGDIPNGIETILNSQSCPPDRLPSTLSIPKEQQWLGLRPLFWATPDSSALRLLLAHGHDPNLTDARGQTAIFYAAADGRTDSVLQLLEAGARPDMRDHRGQTFLDYSLGNDHPSCAIQSLEYLQRTPACSDEVFQTLPHESLVFACERPEISQSLFLVEKFSQLGADYNVLSYDGRSLGHRLKSPAHAEVIFDHGFDLLNVVGSTGETCLHVAARGGNVQLVRFYVSKGARLQERDWYGQNAIHKSLPALRFCNSIPEDHAWYSTVMTLVGYGVDTLVSDHCRCLCSRAGCSPAKLLLFKSEGAACWKCILSLEYLMLLEELTGALPAEQTLVELVRCFLFQNHELTHVCCADYWVRLEEEEISEILDEERLLIDDFEEEVETVLQTSSGRNTAEFWEEFLLESVVKKSPSTSAQDHHDEFDCRNMTCLKCWKDGIDHYSDFVNGIYQKRFDDESTRDLDEMWLQRRKGVIQRCRSTIAPLLREAKGNGLYTEYSYQVRRPFWFDNSHLQQ